MSAYLLTRPEAWALSTLLHLPVQPGSVLNDWLGEEEISASTFSADDCLDALAGKGYYFPSDDEHPIAAALLSCLVLASINAAETTVIIRRAGHADLTRFAQAGDGVMQFGMDEENLTLHPVKKLEEMAGNILPAWFSFSRSKERLRVELPLGAFLLFKQACAQSDLAAADSDLLSDAFKTSDLLEEFPSETAWIDIFNAEGVRGVPSVEQMPLKEYLDELLSLGFLSQTAAGVLEIGAAAKSLADAISDADLCTLSISQLIWEGGFPETGAFLYGAGQLFLLNLKPGKVFIQQLADLKAGHLWIEKLLAKGAAARYANYIILAVPAPALKSPPQSSQRKPSSTFTEVMPSAPASVNSSADATLIEFKPASVEVIVLSGELEYQRFPVSDQLRLGREADNDLTLPDKKASRHHAILQRQGAVYQIIDLKSSSGTYVNGKRITEPTLLKNGDIVLIGDTKLTISDQP